VRKVTILLSTFAIMIVLTVLQRFFLDQSDAGKEWALVAAWFGLWNWFLRAPAPGLVPSHQSETATMPLCAPSVQTTRTQLGDGHP